MFNGQQLRKKIASTARKTCKKSTHKRSIISKIILYKLKINSKLKNNAYIKLNG
jgi:hypothetical protein